MKIFWNKTLRRKYSDNSEIVDNTKVMFCRKTSTSDDLGN